jgi:ectoine hydroxylase-related dioxygenase (phytanoyl-CoA dioxygenase family)
MAASLLRVPAPDCLPDVDTRAVGPSALQAEALTGSHALDAGLSPAQIRRFREQGYLQLGQVCGGAELQQLRACLFELFERRAGYAEGNQFDMLGLDQAGTPALQPQLLKPSLYAPQLLLTRHFQRLQAVARQLLGPDMQFNFDHAIIKRVGSAVATPWHQDDAHHRDPHTQFDQISCWMPLQDVDEINGCMSYLPGSHVGPLLAHHSPQGDPRIHALECSPELFDAAAAVVLPLAVGECIVHDGRTLHAALPNRSGGDRLAYVLAFRSPLRPRTEALTGLEDRSSADSERRRLWRRRGGYLVLLARWLRRVRQQGVHGLARRLQQRWLAMLGVVKRM